MTSSKLKDGLDSYDWAMKAYHNELEKTFLYTLNNIAHKYTSYANNTPITNGKYSTLITESKKRKKQLLKYISSCASNKNFGNKLNFEDLASVTQSYEICDDDIFKYDISSELSKEINDKDAIPVDQIDYGYFHSVAKDKRLMKVLEPLKNSSCTKPFNKSSLKTVQTESFDQYHKSKKNVAHAMRTTNSTKHEESNSNMKNIEKTSIMTRSQRKAIINKNSSITLERNSELANTEISASLISGCDQLAADSDKSSIKRRKTKLMPSRRQNTKYTSSPEGNKKQINKLSRSNLKALNQHPESNNHNADAMKTTNATKFEEINSKMKNIDNRSMITRSQRRNAFINKTNLNSLDERNSELANMEISASHISGCELHLTDQKKNSIKRKGVPPSNASNCHIVKVSKSLSKSHKKLVLMEDLSIHIVSNLDKINSFIYFHDLENSKHKSAELCNKNKTSTHSQSSAFSFIESPHISAIPVQGLISEKDTQSSISGMPLTTLIHSEEQQLSMSPVALNMPSPIKELHSTISNSPPPSSCKIHNDQLTSQFKISRLKLPTSKNDVNSKQNLGGISLMITTSTNSKVPSSEPSQLESASTCLPMIENHSNKCSSSKMEHIQHPNLHLSTQTSHLSARSQVEQELISQEKRQCYNNLKEQTIKSQPIESNLSTIKTTHMSTIPITHPISSKEPYSLISSLTISSTKANNHGNLMPQLKISKLKPYTQKIGGKKHKKYEKAALVSDKSKLSSFVHSEIESPCKIHNDQLTSQFKISRFNLPTSKNDISSKQKLGSISLMTTTSTNSKVPSAEPSQLESASTCLPMIENHSNKCSSSKMEHIQHPSLHLSTQTSHLSARSQVEQELVSQEKIQCYNNLKEQTIKSQTIESNLSTIKTTHMSTTPITHPISSKEPCSLISSLTISSTKANNHGNLMPQLKISKLKPYTQKIGGKKHKKYEKAALVSDKSKLSSFVHSEIESPCSRFTKSPSDEGIPSKILEHTQNFIQKPLPHLSAAMHVQLSHSTLEKEEGSSENCAIYDKRKARSFEGNLSKAAPPQFFSSNLESIMSIKANNELKSLEPTNFKSRTNHAQDNIHHNSIKKFIEKRSTDQRLNQTQNSAKKISKPLILSDTLQPKKMGEVLSSSSHLEFPYYQLESKEKNDDAMFLLCNSSWLGLRKIKSKVHHETLKDKDENQLESTLSLTQKNLDDALTSIQNFSFIDAFSSTKMSKINANSFKTQNISNVMPPPTKIRRLLQMSKLIDKGHDKR